MTILARYIALHMFKSITIVMLALVGISTFFEFIEEVKHLGKAHVSLFDIVAVVILAIPESSYTIFATAVFIGSLLALGGLSSKSELVAMQAATLSKKAISLILIATGIILMVVMVLLGEFILPSAQIERDKLSSKIKSNTISKQLNNIWIKENDYYIKFGQISSANEISNIQVYLLDNNVITSLYEAESADVISTGWRLNNIKKSSFSETQIRTESIPQLEFDWQFDLALLRTLGAKYRNLSLQSLSQFISYYDQNKLDSSQFQLNYWVKLFAPLSVLVMLVLALPFAFGSHRAGNTGNMLVVGLVVGLLYYVSSGILTNLSHLYGLHPILSALTPASLFLLLALFLIMRQKY